MVLFLVVGSPPLCITQYGKGLVYLFTPLLGNCDQFIGSTI
jgi:hypothetical protein